MFYLHEDNALLLMETAWLTPENDTNFFLHTVREALRNEQWSTLAYRRPSFWGARDGADRKATLEIHNRLGGLNRYKLRCILAGAINTGSRMARLTEESPNCRCCDQGVPETPEHIFEICPAHEPYRFTEISREDWRALPPCLKLQGVMPKCNEHIPVRFHGPEEKQDLACQIQHNLLDMWDHRCRLVGTEMPQPRWARDTRARTG